MKILARVLALSLAFAAGIVAGGSGCYLYFQRAVEAERAEEAAGRANEARAVCGFHQIALYQRAKLYHEQFRHWPTNVQALVEAERAEEAAGRANEARAVCGFHQIALYQRAKLYHEQFRHWPTNVQAL